jgi:uncharacterized membrane protein YjjP (DUF1212 family)
MRKRVWSWTTAWQIPSLALRAGINDSRLDNISVARYLDSEIGLSGREMPMAMGAADNQRDPQPAGADAAQLRSHVELLASLGRSLHSSGLPAHRLERTLGRTAERLGVPIQVFSLPTGLMFSVGSEGAPVTVLLRIDPAVVHLERLARLSAIADALSNGKLAAIDAKRQIDGMMQEPPRWRKPATVLAYVLSAGAFAVFFGGALPEIVTAICVGLAVGLIAVTAGLAQISPRLFELTAAGAAAIIANIAYLWVDSFVEWIPLASGLIILLPGLSLVDAVDELAHGHLTSGASRLAGVGVVLLAMTFGSMLGLALVQPEAIAPPATETVHFTRWWVIPALVVVTVGSMIRFRASWEHIWAGFIGAVVALSGAELGHEWLGPFAGPFVAAFLLGLAANVYANNRRQPSQLMAVPGLALLVPGAFGVRSMSALLSEQTAVGVDTAFHMFVAAMALVGGLLFSNAIFRERRP